MDNQMTLLELMAQQRAVPLTKREFDRIQREADQELVARIKAETQAEGLIINNTEFNF